MSTHADSKKNFLKNVIIDALFPVFCFNCREEGFWLCEDCLSRTKIADFQVCPACEDSLTDKGFLCRACRDGQKWHFDALVSAVSYENPAVKKLVHNFKYRFAADIAAPLGNLIVKALVRNDFPLPDFLAPVPLHPRRLRWRGFNQSLLLAGYLSENLAPPVRIEILDILERQKYRPPQMELKNYRDRLENVRDIFALKPGTDMEKINGKKILLVDDIATTGATLEECAKILKAAGARKVFAAVVARQSLKK